MSGDLTSNKPVKIIKKDVWQTLCRERVLGDIEVIQNMLAQFDAKIEEIETEIEAIKKELFLISTWK